ncbi:MAG: hypothetical protein WD424_03680 [Paenibacillaceae bacterium]
MGFTIDENKMKSLLYKYVIIGLSYIDKDDNFLETVQLHGRVMRINSTEGIVVQREDKQEEYKLPLDFDAFLLAQSGEYKLNTTGEIIVDPDYVSSWAIRKP